MTCHLKRMLLNYNFLLEMSNQFSSFSNRFDEKVIYLPNDSLRALKLTKATDFSVGNNMGFNKVDLQVIWMNNYWFFGGDF